MKVVPILSVLAASLLLFIGCDPSNQSDESSHYLQASDKGLSGGIDSVKFEEVGKLSFSLDSLSAPTSPSIHLFDKDQKRYLSVLNTVNSSIDIYSIEGRSLHKRIKLFKQGPDGIGNTSQISHVLVNLDSVVILNPWTSSFFIVNGSGKIIYKAISVLDASDDKSVEEHPRGSTLEPLIYHNSKIFTSGVQLGLPLDDHQKMKCVIIHDTKKQITRNTFPRPQSYNRGNWGGNCMMDFCYATFNKDENKFVYSFPIDPNIYETDHEKYLKSYPARSKFFNEVPPMYNNKLQEPDHKKSVIYDYTTSHYFKIIYDPYAKMYYRFTLLANSQDELADPEIGYNQKESVIILDKNFRKIGENILPRGKYVYSNYFLSKDGLFLLMHPNLLNDENKMVYLQFKLKKLDS